jgi:uncharacterized 2Fe-2S/4Fe-4S cluster protein (DUF4445 family)
MSKWSQKKVAKAETKLGKAVDEYRKENAYCKSGMAGGRCSCGKCLRKVDKAANKLATAIMINEITSKRTNK